MNEDISLFELVKKVVDLVSLPEIYLKIKQLIDAHDSSLTDIADVVSVDPNMTSRILRLSNSPYCGFATKVETVDRAINLLGTQQIHDLVLSISVARSFSKIPEDVVNMEKFWRNSVFCGAGAKLLAEHCNIFDCERMFTAGLLAHIGRLVLFVFLPNVIKDAYIKASQGSTSIPQAIEQQLGFNDADVASALLTHWNLPDTLVAPILHQVHPNRGSKEGVSEEAAIIHVASIITDTRELQLNEEEMIHQIDVDAWNILNLQQESLTNIVEETESLSSELTEQFLPKS